ncbi:MAG: acyl carrier protein [Boseongicola sp.]
MSREQITETLSEIFEDVMDLDDVELTDSTTADDVEEWDSLSHVRLVVAVEREWDISFTNAEIEGFRRVGDLISAIEVKAD